MTEERPPKKTSRRRFLKAGIAFAALVLGGSAVAFFRTRGYDIPRDRATKILALNAWQYVVFDAVARRIVAPDKPGVPTIDDTDVIGFVDGYVAGMAPELRRDLMRLLAYVEHLAPVAAGHVSRFSRLDATAQDEALAALEASSNDLLRGGFGALKSLVFMGYYRDPRTWSILGYDGPLVRRPEGGWR